MEDLSKTLERLQLSPLEAPSRDTLRLLPEIWLDIMPLLHHLDVANLTLTSRYFAAIGQPFLFRSLTFRPFRFDIPSNRQSAFKKEDARRRLDRLLFVTSDKFAHYVRRCEIIPLFESINLNESTSDQGNDDPPPFLDVLFDRLSRFQNLTHLRCLFLCLASRYLATIATLRHLQDFFVTSCRLQYEDSDLPLPILRVPSFKCIHNNYPHFGIWDRRWLSIIHPGCQVSLYLSHPDDSSISLFSAVPTESLSGLRVLSLFLLADSLPALCSLLSFTPNISSLKVSTTSIEPRHISAISCLPLPFLPLLNKYQGPHQLLPFFSLASNPKVLDLTFDHPSNLSDTLRTLRPSLAQTEIIRVGVLHFTDDFLHTVIESCPRIKTLDLSCGTRHRWPNFDGMDTKQLFTAFTQCNMPSTIESMTVSIASFFASNWVWRHLGNLLIDRLRKTCPALHEVEISGAKIKFAWTRTADGVENMEVVEVED